MLSRITLYFKFVFFSLLASYLEYFRHALVEELWRLSRKGEFHDFNDSLGRDLYHQWKRNDENIKKIDVQSFQYECLFHCIVDTFKEGVLLCSWWYFLKNLFFYSVFHYARMLIVLKQMISWKCKQTIVLSSTLFFLFQHNTIQIDYFSIQYGYCIG